jgi:CheY-like chemotaxis protein
MKAHLEIKRSEEALIRQERLSALGQLTSGIAHDFNNMLIPILGYSDLLLECPDLLKDPGKVLSILKTIRSSAALSRETVKRLQECYGADSRPKMEKVNIAELVSEVVEATKPLWKSDQEARSVTVRIREEVPPDLVVTVSRSQFNEALMNLVLNALHAISSGGEVTIRGFVKEETFNLEVSDTGIGMSKDVARKCLEPFFSTKGEEGTGMGLAMVHGIVKRHRGTLHVQSTPGKGTTIGIEIPLAQEDSEAEPQAQVLPHTVRPLKVLVVDDEENSRTLLSEYLALDGHTAVTAVDVMEGIKKFHRDDFDLVITDRAMPDKSGDELVRHVKASEHPVPVLMITGFAQIMASREEHPEGVDCLMGKPFTVQELRSAVDRAFASGVN